MVWCGVVWLFPEVLKERRKEGRFVPALASASAPWADARWALGPSPFLHTTGETD